MLDSKKVIVDEKDSGVRIDLFLSEYFPDHTRSFFTRHIRAARILVNNSKVKPGYLLQDNDEILLDIIEQSSHLVAKAMPLDIVFEDEHILVINKPAGLTVHPGTGTEHDTLVNGLLHYTNSLALKNSSERPGIVHRLDKNTSGLLVVAKNDKAHVALRRQFDDKTISRSYWSLVWGVPKEQQGTVHTHINRSRRDPTRMAVTKSGREAVTNWCILKDYSFFALLQLDLETGRTHQIRLHMNWMGHPVVGDPEYNGRETQLARLPDNLRKRGQHLLNMLPYQFLHAKELSFLHPASGQKVHYSSELPEILQKALDKIDDLFLLS